MEAYRGEVFGALYRIAARGEALTRDAVLATLEEIAAPVGRESRRPRRRLGARHPG